ncbi:MAG TPA: hypothetical protein DC054_16665 [Blastocatellia bacterium]|nr:hypothetical protein [Blastocatellia bacterium]
MKRIPIAVVALLLVTITNIVFRANAQLVASEAATLGGRVFRSDTNVAITNAYILLMQEKERRAEAKHFDIRTDADGKYRFTNIPGGKYTVSIYSWYRDRSDVPCGDSPDAKTADGGHVTVEWQRKSDAFVEIVTITGLSIETDHETTKDFNVTCR